MAKVARTAVQQRPQLLGAREETPAAEADGDATSLVEGVEASEVERMQRIQHRLVVAAQLLGDAWRPFAAGAGEQDLAAAQHKGVGGAQARCQRLALGVRQRTHEDGWSHVSQRTTFSTTSMFMH